MTATERAKREKEADRLAVIAVAARTAAKQAKEELRMALRAKKPFGPEVKVAWNAAKKKSQAATKAAIKAEEEADLSAYVAKRV